MTHKAPTPEFVREFLQSMPEAYRRSHAPRAVAEHAGVALRRGAEPTRVEALTPTAGAPATLCVVADDRPGLLATISAALVLAGIDVIDAEAHTRKTSGGRAEAVDLFWVRNAEPARRTERVGDDRIGEVQKSLGQLLEGKLDRRALGRVVGPPAKAVETTVRFIESSGGDLSTLEVETGDRSGLLLALAEALFEQKVQIVESEVRTEAERVLDRFQIVELDGKPISPARRLEIQVAVLSAVGPS